MKRHGHAEAHPCRRRFIALFLLFILLELTLHGFGCEVEGLLERVGNLGGYHVVALWHCNTEYNLLVP